MTLPEEAIRELSALSGVVLMFDDLTDALNESCRIAVRAVPNATGASLTATSEKGPGAAAASDDWSRSLAEMQYVEHEGPCLDAVRTSLVFRVRDMAEEARWPSYMPRALEVGARSMLSLPTSIQGKTIGALDVYARVRDAFDAAAVSTAQVIAAHVSLASQVSATLFGQRALAAQLQEALRSRVIIEQAKGILMAQQRCSAEKAYAVLRRQSRDMNVKLHAVAEELIAGATT